MTEAYPLKWPAGWPRNQNPERSKFSSSVAQARNEIIYELSRLGADGMVISSNMQLNKDGLPYHRQANLVDTGVAVYFNLNGEERCIPSDKYISVEDNMHAVGLTLNALRSLERWGTGQIMAAAFQGFKALPEAFAMGGSRPWWVVLGVAENASRSEIEASYKKLLFERHPDTGGTSAEFVELKKAYEGATK